jgi:hypothetical protein
MDPNELLRAAPEVQKIVATIVAGMPIAEIVKAVLVPPAAVLGKRMADRVERCFDKTGKMLQASGSPVQEVPEKILIPLLQGVALENDEDLHTMWAALLANAASPENAEKVRQGFIAILKQMSPDEAALLNFLADDRQRIEERDGNAPEDALADLGFDPDSYEQCKDALEAARLIVEAETPDEPILYILTFRGRAFLKACRPPKPKREWLNRDAHGPD